VATVASSCDSRPGDSRQVSIPASLWFGREVNLSSRCYQVNEGGAQRVGCAKVAKILGAHLWWTTAKPYLNPILIPNLGKWAAKTQTVPLEFLEASCSNALCAKRLNANEFHSLNTSTSTSRTRPNLIALAGAKNMIWELQHYRRPTTRPMESLLSKTKIWPTFLKTPSASTASARIRRSFWRKVGVDSEPELVFRKDKF